MPSHLSLNFRYVLHYVPEQALWSEQSFDGQERMLSRCRRFYWPQVLPHIGTQRAFP